MGLFDNLRGIFGGSKNEQPIQADNEYEKSMLSDKIVNLVDKIKRINSFDSSLWNLSNVSSFELKRKSLEELKNIHVNLERRLSELDRQSQRRDPSKEDLEASKWTGQKPQTMTNHDFDMAQRYDDR